MERVVRRFTDLKVIDRVVKLNTPESKITDQNQATTWFLIERRLEVDVTKIV